MSKTLEKIVKSSTCTPGDGENKYIKQFDKHEPCEGGPCEVDLQGGALSAAFVVLLLSNADARALHTPYGLRIANAKITGKLNLDSLDLPFPLVFQCCSFVDQLIMRDAKTRLLKFIGCTLPKGVVADRLKVEGSCVMRACNIHKGVTLNGADISGNLDFRGSHIDAREEGGCFPLDDDSSDKAFKALDAGGLKVGGHLLFGDKKPSDDEKLKGCKVEGGNLPSAVGILRLSGAKVGRNVIFEGGEYLSCFEGDIRSHPEKNHEEEVLHSRDHLDALDLDNAHISGNLTFTGKATFRGSIYHVKMRVEGHLLYQGVCLDAPHFYAVQGDGVQVGGVTIFSGREDTEKKCSIQGIVKLTRGSFGDGLYFRQVTFAHDHARSDEYHEKTAEHVKDNLFLAPGKRASKIVLHGLNLRHGTVRGSFVWSEVRGAQDIVVDLFEADIETFVDDFTADSRKSNPFASWPSFGRVNFDGLRVSSVRKLSEKTRKYEAFMGSRQVSPDASFEDILFLITCTVLIVAAAILPLQYFGVLLLFCLVSEWNYRRARDPNSANHSASGLMFSPRSFNWLILVAKAHGHDGLAKKIAMMRERERRMAGGAGRYIVSFFLWALVGNGYEFKRTVGILTVYILLSTAYFHDAITQNRLDILSGEGTEKISACQNGEAKGACIPAFNPLLYSLDTIVPIVDLQHSQYYAPANDWKLHEKQTGGGTLSDSHTLVSHYATMSGYEIASTAPRLVYWFNTFFGWLMSTVVVAALTPLVRRDD